MIEKISTLLAQLPPNWMNRVSGRAGMASAPEAEIRKLLGEPLPKALDPNELPAGLKALFAAYGMLQKIKKKLEWISRRKGGNIIPAKNTVACVDEDDNIYMGVEFLEKFKDQEDVVAGIMAHEWGHMMSELVPGEDLSHLNWDELLEVRRDEEAAADAFAGKALYQMGYEIDAMADFIKSMAKYDKKAKSHKYHSPALRAEILRQAYESQKRLAEQIDKMFGSKNTGFINPKNSRLIAVA